MAGPTLPAQPDPTPDPNRRVPVHIHHITELLEQIHNLALRQGLSVDDMTEWELGMRRLCIGQGDHHPAFLRNHDAVEAFLVELREMEEQLHEQPFLVSNVLISCPFLLLTLLCPFRPLFAIGRLVRYI